MQYDSFGCLYAPVLGLLVSLYIDVEIGKEGLHAALIIYGYEDGFKILSEIYLLLVYLTWRASILFL